MGTADTNGCPPPSTSLDVGRLGQSPPGIGQAGVAELAQLAVAASVPVIVDTSGPSLLDAVAIGPDVVKPNAHEIASATGIDDPLEGAAALIERGAKAVVVSLGADGMCVVTADQTLRAKPTRTISGNPTGQATQASPHSLPDWHFRIVGKTDCGRQLRFRRPLSHTHLLEASTPMSTNQC